MFLFALGQRRRSPTAFPLAALMAAVFLWTGFAILEESSHGLEEKTLWSNLQYPGIAAAPALWLLFIASYVRPGRRLWPRWTGLLALEPIAVNVLVWTEGGAGLYYRQRYLVPHGGWIVLRSVYGPAFWIHTAYSYALLAAATALIVVTFLRVARSERVRIAPVLSGVAFPWAANALSVSGLVPSDLTPLGIAAACLVFAFGFLRLRSFDNTMREREREIREDDERRIYDLMQHAPLGILQVDAGGIIRFANREVHRLCGYGPGELEGQPLDLLIPDRLRASHRGHCAGYFRSPATVPMGADRNLTARRKDGAVFPAEVGLNPLATRQGPSAVVFLSDISERRRMEWAQKEYEDRLRESNEGLEESVAVRTRQLGAAQAQIASQLRLQHELEVAAVVQKSLLPRHLPSPEGFEFSAAAFPARSVGGDFYDFTMRRPGECLIAVGDISGKGIPAALLTSTARALFRAECAHESSPRRILASLNADFHDDLSHAEMFMTMIVARLGAGRDRLTVANAGGCRVILFRRLEGTCSELTEGGLPLGLFPVSRWTDQSVSLRPGDLAVLYSDGVTETQDPEGNLFGVARLLEIVRARGAGPTDGLKAAVLEAMELHRRGAPVSDDVTLVLIRALPRTVRRTFDLRLETLDALVGAVRAEVRCFGPRFAGDLEVAASEIATNILRHGYAGGHGPVGVEIGMQTDRVTVEFRDEGLPFDLDAVAEPDLQRFQTGGYGIHIVRSFTDELVHESSGTAGNLWRIMKRAGAGAEGGNGDG